MPHASPGWGVGVSSDKCMFCSRHFLPSGMAYIQAFLVILLKSLKKSTSVGRNSSENKEVL